MFLHVFSNLFFLHSQEFKPLKAFLCFLCERIQTSIIHGLNSVHVIMFWNCQVLHSGDFNYTNETTKGFILEISTSQIPFYRESNVHSQMKPCSVSFWRMKLWKWNHQGFCSGDFNFPNKTMQCFILENETMEMKPPRVLFKRFQLHKWNRVVFYSGE